MISTEGPLLPTREWFDPIHMYAMVGTCGQDLQFRTPSVLDLAPAQDTVSQVDQVTMCNVQWVIGSFLVRLAYLD